MAIRTGNLWNTFCLANLGRQSQLRESKQRSSEEVLGRTCTEVLSTYHVFGCLAASDVTR
jgi:hypothetical protein